jgi:hypothetical protein
LIAKVNINISKTYIELSSYQVWYINPSPNKNSALFFHCCNTTSRPEPELNQHFSEEPHMKMRRLYRTKTTNNPRHLPALAKLKYGHAKQCPEHLLNILKKKIKDKVNVRKITFYTR